MDVACSLLLGLAELQGNVDEKSPCLKRGSLGRDPGFDNFWQITTSLSLFSQSTGGNTTFQSLGRSREDI